MSASMVALLSDQENQRAAEQRRKRCVAWLGVQRCDSLAFSLALCCNCRHDTMIQLESAPFSSRSFAILGGMYETLQAIRCIDAEVWRREDEVSVKGGGTEVWGCVVVDSIQGSEPKHFSNFSGRIWLIAMGVGHGEVLRGTSPA